MGTWGTGNFSNDAARDWLVDLEEAEEPLEVIEEILRVPLDETEAYVGASASSRALAAGEVVAALAGRPPEYLPEKLETWLGGVSEPPTARLDELTDLAAGAARQIRDDSELRALWGGDPDWIAVVNDLLDRLGRSPT